MANKAVVLGAGPAGLMAAEALKTEGVEVKGIYTAPIDPRKRAQSLSTADMCKKSTMYGAQFLHGPLHGSRIKHSEPFDVTYYHKGTPDEYTRKVYGSSAPLGSSATRYPDGYRMLGWDVREAYDELWRLWKHKMTPVHLTPAFLGSMVAECEQDGYTIVSTIPRRLTCAFPEDHAFRSQKVWAVGDPDRDDFRMDTVGNNSIHMNGTPFPSWYRAARIQGHLTVEWPENVRPPTPLAVPVEKPLSHTCTCWSMSPVYFYGRYGAWKKSVLLHELYDDVRKLGSRVRVA